MKTTAAFLSELYELDVKLWLEADRDSGSMRLRCNAPEEVLTDDLSTELQQRKSEIIAFLHQAKASVQTVSAIQPADRSTTLPLSFAQQRLWFLEQLQPGTATYHIPAAVRLSGNLDRSALSRSLTEIVRRHESLRTHFHSVGGQPTIKISPASLIELPVIDLRSLNLLEQESEIQHLSQQIAHTPFNLATDLLLRVVLLHLNDTEYVILLTLHHIVADGWSMNILVQELTALYSAFVVGQPPTLPHLPIQYVDFAHWQRQWLQGQVLETQLSYWRKQLGNTPPVLQLPTDFPRTRVQNFRGAVQTFSLSQELSQAIAHLSQATGVTQFMLLLAAYKVFLHRYTGQTDILVGCPIANRNRTEIEGLIGFFVNTLVLRTNLAQNPTFREVVQQVRDVTWQAYDHQDLPFEKLVEALQPERDLSYNPLFQVKFRLENAPAEKIDLPELTLRSLPQSQPTAKLDLSLDLYETPTGLVGGFEYNRDLFTPETINRFTQHFCKLLESIVQNVDRPISELSLLTETELQNALIDWNQTQREYESSLCFHQLFEAQVEKTPDAIAVIFENQHLTYRELNQRSNQVAHYLRQHGIGAEKLVGLCVERSLNMIIGLLGILKAGGAYLPLDPAYPSDRLEFMLADAQVSLLLTTTELKTRFSYSGAIVCLDTDWSKIAQLSSKNPITEVTPENLAYLIYTSGSTGTPKGVMIAHQGLSNLTADKIRVCEVDAESCVLQFFSLSFDASVPEIIMALGSGAKLCLAIAADLLPGTPLLTLLRRHQVTHMTITPSALSMLPAEALPDLRMVLVGGEAPTPELITQWSQGRKFINAYGPTEVTVNASMVTCGNGQPLLPTIAPSANKQLYVLDAALNLVPIGVMGELYIGGLGLARGYLNRPELTADRFLPDPFTSNSRLYRTGDLAIYLPDGRIKLLGRIDDQVKIRGFRIEPLEIEAVLRQRSEVRSCVVIVREDQPGEKRLVAYVVLTTETSVSHLRSFLREKLPEYLIPSAIVLLDELPLTPNGKVDTRSLPEPEQFRAQFVEPTTQLQIQLSEIFAAALNLEKVSIDEDFFEMGGHSLLATQLVAQVLQRFGVELTVMDLFEAPTIAGLAEQITRKQLALPVDQEEREEIEI
jgi:amino acid adenylation domain-containing protein